MEKETTDILLPLQVDEVNTDKLALLRYNFVPEGMSRSTRSLNIDTQQGLAQLEASHLEKVSYSSLIGLP